MAKRYRAVPTTPLGAREKHLPDTSIDSPSSPMSGRRALRTREEDSPDSLRPAIPPTAVSNATPTRQRPRSGLALDISDRSTATGHSMSPTTNGVPFVETSSSRKRPFSVRHSAVPRKGTVVLHPMQAEPDDYLHIPDKNPNARSRRPTWRGCINVLTLLLIACALIMLFAGYPIIANIDKLYGRTNVNGKQQVKPDVQLLPVRQLIDTDTPAEAKTRTSETSNAKYELVFSDEFNQAGRTFWPGDDPFWEAGNFWYGATFDYEWYTPEAIVTTTEPKSGAGVLEITLDQEIEHGQFFRSGMLQSWNKFCFQGGYIEARVMFPGGPLTKGYWPGFWLMGNLGRPGFPASNDGMWPYVYEECDVGIMPNQTEQGGKSPQGAVNGGNHNQRISILPGMRLSSCTCPGEDHPGPSNKVARMAPEIDILELQVDLAKGGSYASQSFQMAPFDYKYAWDANSSSYQIFNSKITDKNTYKGGNLQEAVSCVTRVPDAAFEEAEEEATFTTMGMEYVPDFDNTGQGYITFYVNGTRSWTILSGVLDPDGPTNIGNRIFPKEPMAIVMNLGIADGFQQVSKYLPHAPTNL